MRSSPTADPDKPGAPTREPAGSRPTSTLTARPSASGAPSGSAIDGARRTLRRLSLQQQVGQLLMIGVPATGTTRAVVAELRERHVGSVMLTGRSRLGVEATAGVVRTLTAGLDASAGSGVPLIVATDQEGGAVQVLRGPGFDDIPAALQQSGWPDGRLRAQARRWGSQLRAAGVNLNLAPVADIVPSSPDPSTNGPIGYFDRQYGATAPPVRQHAASFACGMTDAGVVPVVKHFPGLGHVRNNTDSAGEVVDTTIGRQDKGLGVFQAVARECRSVVMTSTAVYDRLDPTRPASFSGTVITQLLRRQLGFDGVVVSDDLGLALQVRAWPPGERARLFVAAGGDLVLSVDPSDANPMAEALTVAARRDPAMRARIRESVLRVLTLKNRFGR